MFVHVYLNKVLLCVWNETWYVVCMICFMHCVTPLKAAYLYRDRVEIITGQVEFSQCEDLTQTFREHSQTVVRQVQALQL